MNRRRLLIAGTFALTAGALACLDPGAPLLNPLDTAPPFLTNRVLTAVPLQVTFNEAMEPRSLRPGLAVTRNDGGELVPIVITLPAVGFANPGDSNQDYTVLIRPANAAFAAGAVHELVFSSLLTDLQGNPLGTADGGSIGAGFEIPFTIP